MSAGSAGRGATTSGIGRNVDARIVAITGVMLAVAFVLTRVVQISIGVGGYIHLGDVAAYVAAFLFGPIVALIAAGGGMALADLQSGYGQWAPGTLIVHGLQGAVVGYIAWRADAIRMAFAAIIGGAIVVAGYFLYTLIFIPTGFLPKGEEDAGKSAFAIAGAAVWPNIAQVVVGAAIALPLVLAIRRAYPPIMRWGAGPTWVEESTTERFTTERG